MLFAALLGNGSQLLVLTTCLLVFALLGSINPGNRGAVYSAAVMTYCLTAFVSGYISTRQYLIFEGKQWALQSLLTCGLFAGPVFIVFSIVNSVAWYFGSTNALPAQSIALIIAVSQTKSSFLFSSRSRLTVLLADKLFSNFSSDTVCLIALGSRYITADNIWLITRKSKFCNTDI
jgi:hypothetical protein